MHKEILLGSKKIQWRFSFLEPLFHLPFVILSYFIPIFFCNHQHTKAFTLLLAEVFVVHFMGPAYGADVGVVASGKPFKTLVYYYFVYNKIGHAIKGDTKANGGYPIQLVLQTKHYTKPAWDGKY